VRPRRSETRDRQQPHFGHRIEAALRVGVERADRLQLGIEQVKAVGSAEPLERGRSGRHGSRTRPGDDLAHVLVAAKHELRAQLLGIDGLPLPEEEGVAGDVLGGASR